jgi:hypothetical protein
MFKCAVFTRTNFVNSICIPLLGNYNRTRPIVVGLYRLTVTFQVTI